MKPILLFAMAFFLTSCHHREDNKNFIEKAQMDSLSAFLASKVEKFSLSSGKDVPDSNELLFYYGKSFDTSFLAHFKREKDKIRARLYQLGFPYHRDEWDVADTQDSLLFFEGYSFKMDTAQWRNIAKAADSVLSKEAEHEKGAWMDAPTYVLAFNSKIRHSDNPDGLLSGFATYLKLALLNQRIAKRQPKLHKVP